MFKFADDTKCLRTVENQLGTSELQEVITRLSEWADRWQMSFNTAKCKIMHIGRNNPHHQYSMGGHILEVTLSEKDVGVMVSNNLMPGKQCISAAKRAGAVISQMARGLTYRDKKTWIQLYKVYVRPHLEYAIQVWAPWSAQDRELMEGVQRRVVRMTNNLKATEYTERLKELGLTSLQDRRDRQDMIQCWRILHRADDVNPNTWFTLARDASQRTTRLTSGCLNLSLPRANGEVRRNFFSHRTVNQWNALPENVKSAEILATFKKEYDRWKKVT